MSAVAGGRTPEFNRSFAKQWAGHDPENQEPIPSSRDPQAWQYCEDARNWAWAGWQANAPRVTA